MEEVYWEAERKGDTDMDLTVALWKLKSIETCVGNGFRSLGEGSSGISLLGSVTLTFFRSSRGHRYRSKHLSKCSWMRFW